MEPVIALLQQNLAAASFAALVLLALGVWLLRRRRPRHGATLRAESGGVVVGGDNHGSISTGAQGTGRAPPAARDWLDVAGLLVAALGMVVAALTWLFPRAP